MPPVLSPLDINALLSPPPPQILRPWTPHRRQTQVHNWPCHNKLRGSVLEAGSVGFYLLYPCLRHWHLQGRVCTSPVPILLLHPHSKPPYCAMVKTAQHLPNPWRNDPQLWPVKEHQLNHHGVRLYQHPRTHPLLSNYPWQSIPFMPRSLQFPNHRWAVVVWCQQDSPKVHEER